MQDYHLLQMVTCAGEATEELLFGQVGAVHQNDRDRFAEYEQCRCQTMDPPMDEDRWNKAKEEARSLLRTEREQRLIKAVAEKLLVHEAFDIRLQLVGITVEAFGSQELPDELWYFTNSDDESPWISTAKSRGKDFSNVLITFIGQRDEWELRRELSGFHNLQRCELTGIAGRGAVRSFLAENAETAEYMSMNPAVEEGQLIAVCLHRMSDLLSSG